LPAHPQTPRLCSKTSNGNESAGSAKGLDFGMVFRLNSFNRAFMKIEVARLPSMVPAFSRYLWIYGNAWGAKYERHRQRA
jgi:hypothetical protein